MNVADFHSSYDFCSCIYISVHWGCNFKWRSTMHMEFFNLKKPASRNANCVRAKVNWKFIFGKQGKKIYTPCTCYKEKVYPLPVISFNDHKWGSLTIDGPVLWGSARAVAFHFYFCNCLINLSMSVMAVTFANLHSQLCTVDQHVC